ncbi:MAG: hypothetical protein DME04_14965 [Candidatus Rokuibacteriota bacterium]|nr:MAG: hypothetical protein DME04_14965 [Candidatus Rokubacteria bacterium]
MALAWFVRVSHAALKPSPQSGKATAIRDLLAHDPVCLEIALYLARNSEAADTARGIAEWWIGRNLASTQEALLKLQACGVVQAFAVQDHTFVYAYTKNPNLRQSIARQLRGVLALHPSRGL